MDSNGKDPVAEVRGADGSRRYAIPLDIEPERGQVPENLSPDGSISDAKQVRHVLDEDVSGSKFTNGSEHLSPQNGFGVVESSPLAGRAGALAGEPSGDEIDGLGGVCPNGSDVGMSNSRGESSGKDFLAPPVVRFTDPPQIG